MRREQLEICDAPHLQYLSYLLYGCDMSNKKPIISAEYEALLRAANVPLVRAPSNNGR